MTRWLFIASTLFASPAWATDAARDMLTQGNYVEARTAALAEETVDGLNLACEVMAAEIMLMRVEDTRDHAKEAIRLTEQALEQDPDNIDAKFLRALHTGFDWKNAPRH